MGLEGLREFLTPLWARERIQKTLSSNATELNLSCDDPEEQEPLTVFPTSILKIDNLTRLDLNGNEFTVLPQSLGQLTNLTELSVNNNQLTSIPNSLENLKRLTSLSIKGNKLTSVPICVSKLSTLCSLDISHNQMKHLPSYICQLTNLTTLVANHNQLTELPESIWRLSNLTSLTVNHNQLTQLPKSISQLRNLTMLNLHENQLNKLPESLSKLPQLTQIVVDGNPLVVPPIDIARKGIRAIQEYYITPAWALTRIRECAMNSETVLDLRGDRFATDMRMLNSVPVQIAQLSHITTLNLGRNMISELPEFIGKLTNLKVLIVSMNKLSFLPDSMERLTNLTQLDLRSNQLTRLPKSLGRLSNLTSLDVSDNQLKVVPESIGHMTSLIVLNMSGNILTELPAFLGELQYLRSLNVRYNRLNKLSASIGYLTQLDSLDVSSNQLTELPDFFRRLTNLTSLDVSWNHITALPVSIGCLMNLTNMNIQQNPIELPPTEVTSKGTTAILTYLRQLLEDGIDKLYEAKMLIIGEPGAGKTTLANKILSADYQLDSQLGSTKGIDVLTYNFPVINQRNFRINIWDFGGQQIYHATHQFFLTKRSLYALVADVRKENTDFDYWLNIVELLSGESPLLIVRNEKQDRKRQLPIQQLKARFRCLKDDFAINLADNRGLQKLIDAIKYHILQLPHIGDTVPKTWAQVRRALDEDGHNWISQESYLGLCEENGFKRHSDKMQLSGYLHDLGVIVHFQDDPVLKHTVFLNPEWITDAVYKVLDSSIAINSLGRFTLNDLKTIWEDDSYILKQDEIVAMMTKFQLCYPLPNEKGAYIAPQLLGLDAVEYDWNDSDNLRVQYHYDFMPKGILSRLIVVLHRYIVDQNCVWRTGVVLKRNSALAEVLEDYPNRKITVRVSGKQQDALRAMIDFTLDQIHHSFPGLKYRILVPCNCEICKYLSNPFFHDWNLLLHAVNEGKGFVFCNYLMDTVEAAPMLRDFTPQREKHEVSIQPPSNIDETEKYLDFNLLTSPNNILYAQSAAGDTSTQINQSLFNQSDLTRILLQSNATNESLLQDFGRILYKLLFPGKIHTLLERTEAALADGQKLRFRLNINHPELAKLPLEFVFRDNGSEFMAVNPNTVISRYLQVMQAQGTVRKHDGPLHLLLIVSPPKDLTKIEPDEWVAIVEEALQEQIDAGLLTLDAVTTGTRKDIDAALLRQKPDIVQFVGHGQYSSNGKGYIALVNPDNENAKWVDEQQFKGYDDHLGLISLASCETAKSDSPQAFMGIAPRLVESGIPAVIAMQYPVTLNTAKLFMKEFYQAIAKRNPVDWAVQNARKAIGIEVGYGKRDFATPVLYMRAKDGQVF